MKAELRGQLFAVLGIGAFALSLYLFWKAALYFKTSNDTTGVAVLGCAALSLLVVAGLHWYMAAGFKFGQVDLVTGTVTAATLQQGHRAVAARAKIQFVRKLDADNASLTAEERYVFFICAYRPWVCKEARFQVL